MAQDQWTAVDSYIADLFIALISLWKRRSIPAELLVYRLSMCLAAQGKLLYMLARIQSARSILELGTLGGYSTIWLARALPPEGRLISLEIDPSAQRLLVPMSLVRN